MGKLIYIADPEIISIPIIECHEPLIDLKNQNLLQYGLPPENELTANCYTKIRKTVFEKLCRAQEDLPKGWSFRLYEGFRSREVQKILFEQIYSQILARNPDKNHHELFHETTRLASPIINLDGSLNIPAHNTGGAIDIEIMTEDGLLIDMGMAAKEWANVDPDLCMTDCKKISKAAQYNRKVLLEVMQAQGFVNYPTEWWHFSYGDRYWAYHKNSDHAIYGSVDEILNSDKLEYEYLQN